tara:strand:+ start:205 stop:1134 length:930 start_codon:yes stop_codon:yes gene_type:complete
MAKNAAKNAVKFSSKRGGKPSLLQAYGPYLVLVLAIAAAAYFAGRRADLPPPPVVDKKPKKPKKVREKDKHAECKQWASAGECGSNPDFMLSECKLACEAADRPPVVEDTWHTGSECLGWAGAGECEKNKDFMATNCALSCSKIVEQRQAYERKCGKPDVAKSILTPDKMNTTFARVMSDFAALEPELISEDPPVVLFHNFLSTDESDAFIKHGRGKYTESRGVGVDKDGKMTDVKTEIRTSSHTWCQDPKCLADPLVQGVVARVADVTQTPEANGEFAQLVYYKACQHGQSGRLGWAMAGHHGFIASD